MISDFMQDFHRVTITRTADGYGSVYETYVLGAAVKAALTTATQTRIESASKDALRKSFRMIFDKSVSVTLGDIFQRDADSKRFRVISSAEDMATPKVSSLDLAQVEVEVYE